MAECSPYEFIGLDCSQMRAILLGLDEGILLWDLRGYLTFANPAALTQLGDGAQTSLGRHWRWLARARIGADLTDVPDDDEAHFPVALALGGQHAGPALLKIAPPDARVRWLRLHARPLLDGAGQVIGAVSSSADVTGLIEQEQSLKRQLHFDVLTGLPNRALFSDRLDQALAHNRRHGQHLAVCLLDLDGFKAVNDVHGHAAGDLLLKQVADRLHETLRGDDTAARIGGDEFALLIGDLKTAGQCEQVIKRILDALATPYRLNGSEARISASIGVTLYPTDATDPDLLLRHADQAMYKAKQSGKNRFCIFDPTLESRSRANLGLIRKIEQALERNEFALHYQPKVDCRAGRVVGFEALIRWNHPVLGMRMPGEFLPLIEQEDVIVHIGDWVIGEALRQQARLRAAGHDLTISVNIAARQLMRRQFAERLEALLEHDDCRDRLEIEILETAALEDIGTVSSLIASFQARGIRFALDDFGTGYSSLVHLKRLAASVLKIDQTFVRDMLDDPGDLAIVQGVVGLAGAFQRHVVAEGVEDMAQVRRLLELGCDVMQGYGISRPLPADGIVPWLDDFVPDPLWSPPSPAGRTVAAH